MRPPPRNIASRTAFACAAAELTDCARLLDVIPCRALPCETRPWPRLFQHDLTRISASIRRSRTARRRARSTAGGLADIRIAVYEDLAAIEQDWRAFEPQCRRHRFSKLSIGSRPGSAISARATACGRRSSSPMTQAGPCWSLLPLAVCKCGFARELALLGSELCDYNAPLLAPGFSEQVDRARFLALWAEIAQLVQANPRLHYDTDHSDQDAGESRRASKSHAAPRRHDQPERRLSHPSVRRLGNLLHRQALIGDPAARPHQAQETVRDGRDPLCRTGRRRRNAARARHLDDAEGAIVCPHGRRQSVCQARAHRILSRARQRSGAATARAHQPARRRRHPCRGQSRADLSRLLLSLAGEL